VSSTAFARVCKHGHLQTEETSVVRPNGKRRCRVCENVSARFRYRVLNPVVKVYALRNCCGRGHVYAAGTFKVVTNPRGKSFRLCLVCRTETGRARNQEKNYGLSIEQWNDLFIAQGRRCAACGCAKHGGKNWHTDHDHATNKVRGILCHPCNVALGQVKDRVEVLYKLAQYLVRSRDGD